MKRQNITLSAHNGARRKAKNGNEPKNPWLANRDHNRREKSYVKKQKHIKQDGIEGIDYEIWEDKSWEDAYTEIFSDAIERHNAKQKHKNRKLTPKKYLENIMNGKNKNPVYETIVTVGNAGNPPENPEIVKEKVYKKFIETWKKRYPNLAIIGAYYHADESREKGAVLDDEEGRINGAPHMHIDWIPVERDRYASFEKGARVNGEGKRTKYLRGLDAENSLNGALEQMGFHSVSLSPKAAAKKGLHRNEKTHKDPEQQAKYDAFMKSRGTDERTYYPVMLWQNDQRNVLERLCKRCGLKIENPKEHREHLDTDDYITEQIAFETAEHTRRLAIDLECEKIELERNNEELAEKIAECDKGIAENKKREAELDVLEDKIERSSEILESIRSEEDRLSRLKDDTDLQIAEVRKEHERELQAERKRLENENDRTFAERKRNLEKYFGEKQDELDSRERKVAEREKEAEKREGNLLKDMWERFERIILPDDESKEIILPFPSLKTTAMEMYNTARLAVAKLRAKISELKSELKNLKKPFQKTYKTKNGDMFSIKLKVGGEEAMNRLADIVYDWETDTPENNYRKTQERQRERERNRTNMRTR